MKKFSLNLKWKAECSGRVNIIAETIEEAIEKINKDKEFYLHLSRNGYLGFEESSEIQEIVEDARLTEECVIKDVTYVSVWDNGSEIIETNAKLNVTTGEVFDIESYSGDKLEFLTTLDGEYIKSDEEDSYVFTVKGSERKVTKEYILNVFEEGRLAFGENLNILYNESEDEVSLVYGDDCNSFVYGEEIFEVMPGAPINSLIRFFNSCGYDVDEE